MHGIAHRVALYTEMRMQVHARGREARECHSCVVIDLRSGFQRKV